MLRLASSATMKPTMEERTKFHAGLDVHKDSISVAAADPGRAQGRLSGKITHDEQKLLKLLA